MYFNFEINSTNNAWNAPINPITYCYLPSKPFEFLLSKDVCIILHQINAYLIWRISPDGHSEHKTNLGFCANIHINSKFSINIAWATLNLDTEPARVEVTKSIFGRTLIIPSPFCGHLILNNHITHIRTNTIEWNIHANTHIGKEIVCVQRPNIEEQLQIHRGNLIFNSNRCVWLWWRRAVYEVRKVCVWFVLWRQFAQTRLRAKRWESATVGFEDFRISTDTNASCVVNTCIDILRKISHVAPHCCPRAIVTPRWVEFIYMCVRFSDQAGPYEGEECECGWSTMVQVGTQSRIAHTYVYTDGFCWERFKPCTVIPYANMCVHVCIYTMREPTAAELIESIVFGLPYTRPKPAWSGFGKPLANTLATLFIIVPARGQCIKMAIDLPNPYPWMIRLNK